VSKALQGMEEFGLRFLRHKGHNDEYIIDCSRQYWQNVCPQVVRVHLTIMSVQIGHLQSLLFGFSSEYTSLCLLSPISDKKLGLLYKIKKGILYF
jgi:hypothetical protein